MVKALATVIAAAAVTFAVVFEINKYAKPVAVALMVCNADPSKITAREFAVNVPLLVQLPPIRKSPPEAVDKAKKVEALMIKLPRKRRYWVEAPKFTLVEAVDIVTFCGTPCPVRAFAVHSVPAP
jgi:hypothetical protein